jgi:hypothetical protein
MRKIKEILRLHFEQKLGQRQIARSIRTSQSTVREYLTRAKAAVSAGRSARNGTKTVGTSIVPARPDAAETVEAGAARLPLSTPATGTAPRPDAGAAVGGIPPAASGRLLSQSLLPALPANRSASDVFRSLQVAMETAPGATNQQPELDTSDTRRQQPLFGGAAGLTGSSPTGAVC